MIENPIIRGFNPDPSIIRVKDTYYIATSTFEWWPGVAGIFVKGFEKLAIRPLSA